MPDEKRPLTAGERAAYDAGQEEARSGRVVLIFQHDDLSYLGVVTEAERECFWRGAEDYAALQRAAALVTMRFFGGLQGGGV